MELSTALLQTVANTAWVTEHTEQIKACLPQDWTAADLELITRVSYRLKLLGIDFRTNDELAAILAAFERMGLLLRDDYRLKVNSSWEMSQITHFGLHPQLETRHVH